MHIIPDAQHWPSVLHCSVVNPDPVGSETLTRIRILMILKQNYSEKVIKTSGSLFFRDLSYRVSYPDWQSEGLTPELGSAPLGS